MSCPIDIGDTFEWTEDYKEVCEGDRVVIEGIYVSEDGVPQVTVSNYRDERELVTARDIQGKVSEGLLERL